MIKLCSLLIFIKHKEKIKKPGLYCQKTENVLALNPQRFYGKLRKITLFSRKINC